MESMGGVDYERLLTGKVSFQNDCIHPSVSAVLQRLQSFATVNFRVTQLQLFLEAGQPKVWACPVSTFLPLAAR